MILQRSNTIIGRIGGEPLCLLERPPVDWLVCFVPPNNVQWWHPLLRSPLKHCFCLRRERSDTWILFEPWWSRVLLAVLTDAEAEQFLNWGRRGTIISVIEHVPGDSSQLRGWLSCAAQIAHILGRKYFVYTPYRLLQRLLAEPETKIIYQEDSHGLC